MWAPLLIDRRPHGASQLPLMHPTIALRQTRWFPTRCGRYDWHMPTRPASKSAGELDRAFAAGRADLEQAYRAHGSLVYGICRKAIDEQAAKEVTQDVFLSAWRGREQFDPNRGTLAGWLVAVSRTTDHRPPSLRAPSRRPQGDRAIRRSRPRRRNRRGRLQERIVLVEALQHLPVRTARSSNSPTSETSPITTSPSARGFRSERSRATSGADCFGFVTTWRPPMDDDLSFDDNDDLGEIEAMLRSLDVDDLELAEPPADVGRNHAPWPPKRHRPLQPMPRSAMSTSSRSPIGDASGSSHLRWRSLRQPCWRLPAL